MKKFTLPFKAMAFFATLACSVGAWADESPWISIEVNTVYSTDAYIYLIPKSEDTTFYWMLEEKDAFEAQGGVDKLVENTIDQWTKWGAMYDETWQGMMESFVVTGSQYEYATDYYGRILWDTDYIVYAFSLDNDGNLTNPVVTTEFHTLQPEASDNIITLELASLVDNGNGKMTATAHATPSIDNEGFVVRCLAKELVDNADLTPGSPSLKHFISDEVIGLFNYEDLMKSECDVKFPRLKEGEEYYLLAMGIDDDIAPTTEIFTLPFKCSAEQAEPTEKITLEISDITPMNAHIRIIPSSDDLKYYYDISTKESVENHGGTEMIANELIINWWKFLSDLYGDMTWLEVMEAQTRQGTLDGWVADLAFDAEVSEIYWGTEYVLYAVAFDAEGKPVTKTATLEFKTPTTEKNDMTFDFEMVAIDDDTSSTSKRKPFTATVDVYPSTDLDGEYTGSYRVNYMKSVILDQYGNVGDLSPEDEFEFITRQFYDSYLDEFTDPVRLVMPDLYGTDFEGNLIEYIVVAMGWEEGPTTPINVFRFNYETSGFERLETPRAIVTGGEGRIHLTGDCENCVVYAMNGTVMGALPASGTVSVPAGIYIVRYTSGGTTMATKVLVR